MANNKFTFKPIILDQDTYTKRRVIRQLPAVHQTETLQKFFASSVDHLFDAGKAKPINGYVGQRPLWLNPSQDFYLQEPNAERQFYQLEPSMVSRASDSSISNLLFYPDMVNQIRYQGGNIGNHSRLFDQEYYSWCPPIDLDKNINFRQYFWLEEGPPAIRVWGPKTDIALGDGIKTDYRLPDGAGTLYQLSNINPVTNIRVLVDGRTYVYTNTAGQMDTFQYSTAIDGVTNEEYGQVTIYPVPPVDAEVQVWVYSDVSNLVIGKNIQDSATKAQVVKALGGIMPSSGMKIRLMNDINPAFNGKTFVFENVAGELMMLDDDGARDPDSLVDDRDYLTMARGCRDGNPWSRRNRWFHRDVADNELMETSERFTTEELLAVQANRPIVEFTRDLELYNYGRYRRADVHISVNGLANSPSIPALVSYVNAHPTELHLDGLVLKNGMGNTVDIDGVLYDSVRLLVQNTNETSINNRIYSVVSQAGLPLLTNNYADWRIVPEADLQNGFMGNYDATYIETSAEGQLVLMSKPSEAKHFVTAKTVVPKPNRTYRSTIVMRKINNASVGQVSKVIPSIDGLRSDNTVAVDLGKVYLNGTLLSDPEIDTSTWDPYEWQEIQVEWTSDVEVFDKIRAHLLINYPGSGSTTFSDTVFEVKNQHFADVTLSGTAKLSLVLDSDGQDPTGTPVNGEVVKVLLGSKANYSMFFDGVEWVEGQQKQVTGPLFNLYDMNGVALDDPGVYPKSTFQGSRLFSYDIDENGSRPRDTVLGFRPVYDNKGQFKFKNYTATERFSFTDNNEDVEITGLYFNKTTALNPDDDQLSNDWYKAARPSRQMIVDQFVADGTKKIFTLSQVPADQDPDAPLNLQVVIGRADANKDFQKITLVEGTDFIRSGRDILIFNVLANDVIDVRTFNPEIPTDATGFYEVPKNLESNPLSEEVTTVSKGDVFDHFAEIMRLQDGFQGTVYAGNNWRDTKQDRSLGQQIIQNSASLLKAMLLSSEDQLDFMNAVRYAEAEYARFRAKFEQKIGEFWHPEAAGQTQLTLNDSIDKWIDTALKELNRGKTKSFPFFNSGVGVTTQNTGPTFIPASPSFLGVYPLYAPQIIEDTTNNAGIRYILGHDGSMTLCYQNGNDTLDPRDQVILALETRIYNSVPENIKDRERPIFDYQAFYSDKFRTGDYSYTEFLDILRPAFERWNSRNGLDYKTNDLEASYDARQTLLLKKANDPTWDPVVDQAALDALEVELGDVWQWNWSSVLDRDGQPLPGNWRGIYQLYFGTDRPHTAPWEMLGFTSEPTWWFARYGSGPYTSDNHIMWDEIEKGYIAAGSRQGYHAEWARPGLTGRYDAAGNLLATPTEGFVPVDHVGELLHPGPRDLDAGADFGKGCGIASALPLLQDAVQDWKWGDRGPVETVWARSNHYPFAVAEASYLMKPARFIEYGWDSANLVTIFPGTSREQLINRDTKSRAIAENQQVHGEVNDDFTIVQKFGIQQWVSDFLASRNLNITESFGNKVRGLASQLAYKVAGFTDSNSLFVVSDSFDRVPKENVSTSLYRSPSVREEFYSGVIIEKSVGGWRVFGFDVLDPSFKVVYGDTYANQLSVGGSLVGAPVPNWKSGVNYSVNIIVRYSDHFYRAITTHTSGATFEPIYWVEVDRPLYADGNALLWNLDSETTAPVTKVPYGTLLQSPQDIADFLNAYQRYLTIRGFVFDTLDDNGVDVLDWRSSLLTFITWSQTELVEGDFLALSPASGNIKYVTDDGTIQPVERIVNGVYAIVDRSGNPIQPSDTSVLRFDGELSVTPNASIVGGIFGLRLYVSEVEHVIVLSNTTIFNDAIYNPVLGIRQPRMRLQGFKTRNWKGRIDAPGFVVTGNTLIPNFEKTADDFRQYFAIETIESSKLQAMARANLGYEEREYLDNLLLTPTNQLELYQGMIQQKGTPAAMKRLLRSNFIRHNKGMKFFEEWAFRVGDYGGSEVKPTMVMKLIRSDIKNNPQLIEFNSVDVLPPTTDLSTAIVSVNDVFADGVMAEVDDRWVWRPDQQYINWPAFKEKAYEKGSLPRAGYVNVNEASFYLKNESDLSTLLDITFDAAAATDKRIWIYGFDTTDWATYRFAKAPQNIVSVTPSSFDGQATIISLDAPLFQNTLLAKRNRDTNYVAGELEVVNNRIILRDFDQTVDTPLSSIYRPAIKNSLSITLTPASDEVTQFFDAVSVAGLQIDGFDIEVIEPFIHGSTLILGTEETGLEDLFVRLPASATEQVSDFSSRANQPVESYVVERTYEISQVAPAAEIEIVRVGQFEVSPCDPTYVRVTWSVLDTQGQVVSTSTELLAYDPAHQVQDDSSMVQVISVPLAPTVETARVRVQTTVVVDNGDPDFNNWPEVTKLIATQHTSDDKTITVVRPSAGGSVFIDLSKKGSISTNLEIPSAYPYDMLNDRIADLQTIQNLSLADATAAAKLNTILQATLDAAASPTGQVKITVHYHYTQGFELYSNDAVPTPVITDKENTGGKIYGLVPTRFKDFAETQDMPGLNVGLVEIDAYDDKGWAVYDFSVPAVRRHQNSRVQSKQITGAAIYDQATNELRQTLQLFDPVKGFIPGVADRELSYKLDYDPADYNRSSDDSVELDEDTKWGPDQVGQLWWDLSTTRYLDYEINDDLNGGVDYRWKHWGRLAPGIEVDIYEWTRSTSHPTNWDAQVKAVADVSIFADTDKPTGVVKNATQPNWVERQEWNEDLQRNDTVYYFWVKDVITVPPLGGRNLTAQQVRNIIQDPISNDIPYIAIIDTNKIIVGATNQYLDDKNSVLRVSWKLTDGENEAYETNHHKQWAIIREGDERNTINARMWNKMRDSLVGWDTYQNTNSAITTLAVGFDADDLFASNFNVKLTDATGFLASGKVIVSSPTDGNVWISYEYVDYATNTLYGATIDNLVTFQPIPAGVRVSQERALDEFKSVPDPLLSDDESLGNMIRPRQSWFPAELVDISTLTKRPNRYARQMFVEAFNEIMSKQPFADQWYGWQDIFETGTTPPDSSEYAFTVSDFTELEQLPTLPNPIKAGQLAYVPSTTETRGFWTLWRWTGSEFLLERSQDFCMQEGELWSLTDWYADGWSGKDFPIFRFKTMAERDAAVPLGVTIAKGTLVSVAQQSDTDLRWSWHLYTSTGWVDVAKQNATFKLNSHFFEASNSVFTPVKGTTLTAVKNSYRNAILKRDGTWEIKWLVDELYTKFFTKLQANELFFSMVKTALALNQDTDWVFKTSFLYLGGYSEELKQSPVAQADQIDNVVAYLEEVKPYHVKIRDYVRRLSYGPDIANFMVTDFDKPIYADENGNRRVLNPLVPDDLALIQNNRPWKDWWENNGANLEILPANASIEPGTGKPYPRRVSAVKTNYNLKKWDDQWNPIRRFRSRVQIDRIACSSTNGWDYVEVPWDSAQIRYHHPTVFDALLILNTYRDLPDATISAAMIAGDLNPYKDATVLDIDARNLLVRERKVIRGTVVTVLGIEPTFWIWSGTSWIQIWATQWDGNWYNGAVDRIEEAYAPLPGMRQKDSDNLISGCGIRGTKQDGDYFEHGMFDQFSWDYQGQGWADEFEYFAGLDIKINPEMTGFDMSQDGEPYDSDGAAINIEGAELNNLTDGDGHPEELARIKAKDPLTITVYQNGAIPTAFRVHKNGLGHWENVRLDEQNVTVTAWDPATRELTIGGVATFPFHDPANPSKEFLDRVRTTQGYRATKSSNTFSLGVKQFKLTEWNANKRLKTLPADLMPRAGQTVEVIIEEPGNSDVRMVGRVNFSGNLQDWLDAKTLDIEVTGYIGDSSALPAVPITDWNIIPKRIFNQLGVIWINHERLTYQTVSGSAGSYVLGGVRRGTATTFAQDTLVGEKVYDGSVLKWLPNGNADLRRVPGQPNWKTNYQEWKAFIAQSTGGPTP